MYQRVVRAPPRSPVGLARRTVTVGPMRTIIQRVARAAVTIDSEEVGRIDRGLLVLAGFEPADTIEDLAWLSGKLVRLRIFPDDAGKMNRSVQDVGGSILVISQFTLFADTAEGNRPSFTRAAKPTQAMPLYEAFLARLETDLGRTVERGRFGADMQVSLINDGPVTIAMDSRRRE